MKRLIILIFIGGLLFAIKPVPKDENATDQETSKIKTETIIKETNKNQGELNIRKESPKDIFQDADSNSINDQREHDFQEIKQLKTKFKNLFDQINKEKPKKSTNTRDKSK